MLLRPGLCRFGCRVVSLSDGLCRGSTGRPLARCLWVLFQRPPARTGRDRFGSSGSPMTTAWLGHAGHSIPFRRSASRVPPGLEVSDHLASFALLPAFPDSLVGRYSHDYYEASVAIGLAPLGDPTFVLVVRIERDLGGQLISLNALTGHRSTSRRLRRPSHDVDTGCGTGFMRLSGGCVFASSGDLAIRQSSYSPYHAGPAAPRFIRLTTTAAFLAGYCSLHLSDPGEPSDPGTSLRVPPG